MKMPDLSSKYALVTGASRGIGRGIALQLADAGTIVYITGRQPRNSAAQENESFPSLEKVKQEIEERGGQAVLVYCDHSDAEAVKKLFEQIEAETNGQLDILVNNAFSAINDIKTGKRFYEADPLLWDSVNNVGLRNHYICAVYASRMMIKRNSGLIVNVSSMGGLKYAFNVAYGCGKAALDRMATDMAVELKDTGVTILSLWPAAVKTEAAKAMIASGKAVNPNGLAEERLETGESPEFAGRCIAYLAADEEVHEKTGKILLTCDVAKHYQFKDIDGKIPMDMRSLVIVLRHFGWNRLASWIPSWVRIPLIGVHMVGYKFA